MINAIGLNATVVTDDGKLVLVRRSARADSGRDGWHISVNEGMLPTDRNHRGVLAPEEGIIRGLLEELGISGMSPDIVRFHTAMLDLRRLQFGLLGHVDLRDTGITAADIAAGRQTGYTRDRFENHDLVFVDWTLPAVRDALRRENWIAHGRLNLFNSAVAEFDVSVSELQDLLDQSGTGHIPMSQRLPRRRPRKL